MTTAAALAALVLPSQAEADCLACDTFVPVSYLLQPEDQAETETPDLPTLDDEVGEDQVEDAPRRAAAPS